MQAVLSVEAELLEAVLLALLFNARHERILLIVDILDDPGSLEVPLVIVFEPVELLACPEVEEFFLEDRYSEPPSLPVPSEPVELLVE